MTPSARKYLVAPLVAVLAIVAGGCGDYIRRDNAPVTLVITTLEGAPGSDPATFTSNLISDVQTNMVRWNDLGRVTLRLILKDPGTLGIASAPTAANQVTIERYRVVYRAAPGTTAAVPAPFEGAVTFTVPADGQATAAFQLVRTQAKFQSPLVELTGTDHFINAIADVTFFGRDQVGNQLSVTGSIQVEFGDFIDP